MKKKIGFVLYIGFVLFTIELVLRYLFPLPEVLNFNRSNYQLKELDPENTAFLRNQNAFWSSRLDTNVDFIHALNEYGFRDDSWKLKKDKNKRRILFIGDSFTEGVMANQSQTIPETFKKLGNSSFEVFNMGMVGVGWNTYIKLLSDAVPLFKPDEVMIFFYANDMPKGNFNSINSNFTPENICFWKPHLLNIHKEYQESRPTPFRFIKGNSGFLKSFPSKANPWTFNESNLSPHVSKRVKEVMKKGQFNYYRINWILKEEKGLKQSVSFLEPLRELHVFLKHYDCTLSIVYIPSRSQISNQYYSFEKECCLVKCPDSLSLMDSIYNTHQQIIKSSCRQLGVPFLDLTSFVRREDSSGDHLYWNFDDHFRGKTYELVGEKVYNWKKSK